MAATTGAETLEYSIETVDVPYLRHGETALLARLFKPRGHGPFPGLIELHGGAWCLGDRLQDELINEKLARRGILVAALDFRMPPSAHYPSSLADINYAIRWLKAHAIALGIRPEMVCTFGISSGAHQAMLLGMKPRDSRYAAIALAESPAAFDASVRGVIMGAPVIDPLARYRFAQELKQTGGAYREVVDLLLPLHDRFWQNEEAMAEGNPVQILERGEAVETPPVLCVHDTRDIIHPRSHLERFIELYRKAGGPIELMMFEGAIDGLTGHNPNPLVERMYGKRDPASPAAARVIEKIISFIHASTS